MPIAKVQLEDGRIARFEVPEGTTPEQVMAFANSSGQSAPKPTGRDRGALSNATATLENAFTLGLGNEMAGAARAVGPLLKGEFDKVGDAYRSGRDDRIAQVQGFKDRNPVTGVALEVAGGLANPVAQRLGPTPGAGLLKQSGQAALQGAGLGAVYGFNDTAGDIGDRAGGAGTGALVGGATGAVAPGIVEGLSKGLQYGADQVVRRFTQNGQNTIAGRKTAESALRDGFADPAAMAARLQELGPNAVMADLGNNTQALAGAISRAPGQGKTALTDFVTARQEGVRDPISAQLRGGQYDRVSGILDEVTPTRFRQSIDALDAQRKSAAAPLYNEAYSANKAIDSPLLQRIEQTPAGQRAFEQARAMMRNDMQRLGVPDSELTALAKEAGVEGGSVPKGGVASGLKLEFWDYVKRALDDQIGAAQRGGANNEARVLTGLKGSLVKELDALDVTAKAGPNSLKPEGGAYAQARAAYSGPSQLIDATEQGATFLQGQAFKRSDDVGKALSDMTPDQREAFRVGAVQALRDKIGGKVSRADLTKALKDIPDLEAKVRIAFGDDATFKRYIDRLTGESQLFKTYAEITGNSKTAARQAADMDLNKDRGGVAEAAVGIAANPLNPMNYLRGAMQLAGNVNARMATPEGARDQIARLLMSRDPNALGPRMQAVQMSEARRAALSRALLGQGAQAN